MDETKRVSVAALALGELLFRIPPGAELATLEWAVGTPKGWANDMRSDNPEWRVMYVSPRQVLAFRFRA